MGSQPLQESVVRVLGGGEEFAVGQTAVRGVAGGQDERFGLPRPVAVEPGGHVEGHPTAHAVSEEDVRAEVGFAQRSGDIGCQFVPVTGEVLGEPPLPAGVAEHDQVRPRGHVLDPRPVGGRATAEEGQADQSPLGVRCPVQGHQRGVQYAAHRDSPVDVGPAGGHVDVRGPRGVLSLRIGHDGRGTISSNALFTESSFRGGRVMAIRSGAPSRPISVRAALFPVEQRVRRRGFPARGKGCPRPRSVHFGVDFLRRAADRIGSLRVPAG